MSFINYLDQNSSAGKMPDALPLVHSTRTDIFRSISKGNKISPRKCPVFAEKLLYFFYGRPAYRVHSPQIHSIGYCPICFILKPNTSVRVVRAYPFDSGAVRGGRAGEFVRPVEFDLYRLRRSLRDAKLVVKTFYKKNEDYLLGNVKRLPTGVPVDAVVQKYLSLLKDRKTETSDDRRSAIEIQTKDDIDLKTSLLAVVLPTDLLKDQNVRHTLLQKWGVLPITYPTFAATNPTEYSSVIRDLVVRFFQTHRILS